MVTPSRGTTFGCLKCFHITASLQKTYGLYQPRRVGREMAPKSDLLGFICTILRIHPHAFYANI